LWERAPKVRADWTGDFGNGLKLMPGVAVVFGC
jgi:hypothetical protein